MVVRLVTDEFERISKELDFIPNEVIFRHFPEGLRKMMESLSVDMRFSGQDSNRAASELKFRALPLRQTFGLPGRERILLNWVLRKYILGIKNGFTGVRIGSIGLPVRNFGLYKFLVTNSAAIKFSTMDLFS
jgi:hypothetical protein